MIRRMITLTALLGCGAAAHGQTKVTGDAARSLIESVASCAVERNYSKVAQALAAPRDYKRDSKLLRRLSAEDCRVNGSAIVVDPMMFRGALFRVLLRKNYAGGPGSFGDAPYVETGAFASIMNFAGCVVRADPANSYNVVMAPAGSVAEDSAFDSLQPDIKQCVPWDTMNWDKANLIYFFSEAYYHEAAGVKSASLN